MSVTFVLGRAGSGKTHFCIQGAAARLRDVGDPARLLLLVPEQATFQTERALALAAPRRGFLRAEIAGFSRLTRRTLDEAGAAFERVDSGARRLALRFALGRAPLAPLAFGAVLRSPGFIARLESAIQQMLTEALTPDDVRRAAAAAESPNVRLRLEALAQVLAEYRAWLGDARVDAACEHERARLALERAAWLPSAFVWIDGFAGFTGQEFETLRLLARRAREVFLTFLTSAESPAAAPAADDWSLFAPVDATLRHVARAFRADGIEIRPPVRLARDPRRFQSWDLRALESTLAAPPTPSSSAQTLLLDGSVRVLRTRDAREELRIAAAAIRTQVAVEGSRFRDFALVARDLTGLESAIAAVFDEYHIPYFLDQRRSLESHAICRLVLALLDAVRERFSGRSLRRVLHSGLSGVPTGSEERVDSEALEHAVDGLAAWRRSIWDFRRRSRSTEPPSRRKTDAARVRFADGLLALEPLTGRTASAREWAERLAETLQSLGVARSLSRWIERARRLGRFEEAELHRQAWETLVAHLEQVHELLGGTQLEADEFRDVLGQNLRDATIGLTPPTLDQVLIGSIERSRHPEVRHVWLIGFNEGAFPAQPADDPLIGPGERLAFQTVEMEGLARPATDPRAERLLAYIALTRASHALTISYSETAADGEPAHPSPFLQDVLSALPGLQVETPPRDAPPTTLSDLAYARFSPDLTCAASAAAAIERLRDQPEPRAVLDRLLRGRTYAPAAFTLPATDDRPESEWSGSVSAVQSYLDCPYRHFLRAELRLRVERGPLRLDRELGDLAHEALANLSRRVIEDRADVRKISDDEWAVRLQQALRDVQDDLPADHAERRPDLAFHLKLLAGHLRSLVLAHGLRWRLGRFKPLRVESGFGLSSPAPAVTIRTRAGRIGRIHGRIDRVDVAEVAGRLYALAYDYKTARPRSILSARPTWLTGAPLQIMVYALALAESSPDWSEVAGVFLAPLFPNAGSVRALAAQNTPAERAAQRAALLMPRGMLDANLVFALDRDLRARPSPAANITLVRSGFRRASDVLAAAELAERLDTARETIAVAVDGLCARRVEAAPLFDTPRRRLACVSCDFAAICRYDEEYHRPRLIELTVPAVPPRTRLPAPPAPDSAEGTP